MSKQLTNRVVNQTVSTKHSVEMKMGHVERPVMDDVFSDAYSFDELDALAATPEYVKDLEAIQTEISIEKKYPGIIESMKKYQSELDDLLSKSSVDIDMGSYYKFNNDRHSTGFNIEYYGNGNYSMIHRDNKGEKTEVFSCQDGELKLHYDDFRIREDYKVLSQEYSDYGSVQISGNVLYSKSKNEMLEIEPVVRKAEKFTDRVFSAESDSLYIDECGNIKFSEDVGIRRDSYSSMRKFKECYESGAFDELKAMYKSEVNKAVYERKALIEQYKTNPEKSRVELFNKQAEQAGISRRVIDKVTSEGAAIAEHEAQSETQMDGDFKEI